MGRLSTSTKVVFPAVFVVSLGIGFVVSMVVDVLGLSLSPLQTSLAGAITSVVLVSATLIAIYGIPPWHSEPSTPDVDVGEFEIPAPNTAPEDDATETDRSLTCPNCGTEFDSSAASVGDRCGACGDGYLTRAGDRVVLDDGE